MVSRLRSSLISFRMNFFCQPIISFFGVMEMIGRQRLVAEVPFILKKIYYAGAGSFIFLSQFSSLSRLSFFYVTAAAGSGQMKEMVIERDGKQKESLCASQAYGKLQKKIRTLGRPAILLFFQGDPRFLLFCSRRPALAPLRTRFHFPLPTFPFAFFLKGNNRWQRQKRN